MALRLEQIDSIAGFRAVAGDWDDLWRQSEVTLPTVRAELVAQWLEVFAPRAEVRGLLVWEDDGALTPGPSPADGRGEQVALTPGPSPEEGRTALTPSPSPKGRGDIRRLVAALPLVGRRAKGVLPVGDLASNYWSASGELLLDPAADADAVLGLVADGLQQAPWPLVWLDLVPVATSRWQTLARVLGQHGLHVASHVRYQIGQVELGQDFAAFETGLSKNLRRSLCKDLRRLEQRTPGSRRLGRSGAEPQRPDEDVAAGAAPQPTNATQPTATQPTAPQPTNTVLRLVREFAPGDVRARLAEVFALETRGWKNRPGQAVLKTPGMLEFYCRQAEQLAAWGCLRVALLDHGGQAIAGELGWVAKGVYHSFKVAYDEEFAEFGPGHLLRRFLVEEFCRTADAGVIDFQGPLTGALASWATRRYPIGRLVIAPKRPASRILFTGYRAAAAVVRRMRGTAAP